MSRTFLSKGSWDAAWQKELVQRIEGLGKPLEEAQTLYLEQQDTMERSAAWGWAQHRI